MLWLPSGIGAFKPEPFSLSPTENGWVLADGSYKIKWFEGDTVPQEVWRILDAATEALEEEVEYDISDPVTDESCYMGQMTTLIVMRIEAIVLVIIAAFRMKNALFEIFYQDWTLWTAAIVHYSIDLDHFSPYTDLKCCIICKKYSSCCRKIMLYVEFTDIDCAIWLNVLFLP